MSNDHQDFSFTVQDPVGLSNVIVAAKKMINKEDNDVTSKTIPFDTYYNQ
jgi:hypothetical protein